MYELAAFAAEDLNADFTVAERQGTVAPTEIAHISRFVITKNHNSTSVKFIHIIIPLKRNMSRQTADKRTITRKSRKCGCSFKLLHLMLLLSLNTEVLL